MHDQRSYILLGEDEPHIIYLFQRYAARSSYGLVYARSGRELVTLAHQGHPSVIMLDLDLHQIQVEALLHDLHASVATRLIPILLYGSSELLLRKWEGVVDGCWLKPLLYDDFVGMLVAVRAPTMTVP